MQNLNEIVKQDDLQKKVIVENKEVIFCNLTKDELSEVFDFLNDKELIKKGDAGDSCVISLEGGLSGYGSNGYITTGDFELIKEYLENNIVNPFKE